MRKIVLVLILILVAHCLFAQFSEKRVALVIGNKTYQHGSILTYPEQDAKTIKDVLETLDFNVIYLLNATKIEMQIAFLQFLRASDSASISLVYYSGHGQQINGTNYLIPVDANITDKYSATELTINVNDWVSKLEVNHKKLNIVILDACRNNNFKSFVKGNENGLRQISTPSGTIIAFATLDNNVAQDNGLYAKVLSNEMIKPQRIEDVFINTRNIIEIRTNGQQSPMEWTRIKGKFYLKPGINRNEIGYIPNPPSRFEVKWIDKKGFQLGWVDNSLNELGFNIYRKREHEIWKSRPPLRPEIAEWELLYSTEANAITYFDDFIYFVSGDRFLYEIASYNSTGESKRIHYEIRSAGDFVID